MSMDWIVRPDEGKKAFTFFAADEKDARRIAEHYCKKETVSYTIFKAIAHYNAQVTVTSSNVVEDET